MAVLKPLLPENYNLDDVIPSKDGSLIKITFTPPIHPSPKNQKLAVLAKKKKKKIEAYITVQRENIEV